MFSQLMGWLERRIDIFAPFDETHRPPSSVRGFIWHYIRPFRGLLAVTTCFTFATSVIEASMLLLVGKFIDLLTHSTPSTLMSDHGTLLWSLALYVVVFRPVVLIVTEMLVNQSLVTPVISRVRWRTHLYTLGHSLSYFQNDYAGRLANRIMQSGPGVQAVAVEILDVMVYVVIYSSVALFAFSTISWQLALPVLIWMTSYVAMLRYFVPRAVKLSHIQSSARSVLMGRIVDSYTNIQTVKLFARVNEERSTVRDAIIDHSRKALNVFRLLTGTMAALFVMNAVLLAITCVAAIVLWQNNAITVGEIASGLALILRLSDMSRWVMQVVRGIFENLGTVQESMETISKPHSLTDTMQAQDLKVHKGEITFDHVRFHYGKGGGVIDDLHFTIKPGEKVGLVGPSGAGKSTIVSLLLRLYDLEGGHIRIDGQDIANATQDSLRAQIGVVTQDNSLLHRSIGKNIAYGRDDASEQDIINAAKQAKAHDFILDLADKDGYQGYDSRVGERGVKLSGGQRQRISIARVLLKDAPILVLDEATSALDSQVENAIQEQLVTLMAGKTVIAIAHRLSTIAAMDRLIVMDKGMIMEQGTHHELVARGGLYASLWAHQSGGFLAEIAA